MQAERQEDENEGGEGDQPLLAGENILLPGRNQGAERGRRRRNADADNGQGRLGRDRQGKRGRGVDGQRAGDVRQEVDEDEPRMRPTPMAWAAEM